ncbi:hypothetical protein WJX73_000814 [Symbiochloris irregularis]|uniref:Uncharacterized protein n=1 Tax=Symbiochloris irregularis TaxID=706552 RepID=A0AAW1PFF9_9CHLO
MATNLLNSRSTPASQLISPSSLSPPVCPRLHQRRADPRSCAERPLVSRVQASSATADPPQNSPGALDTLQDDGKQGSPVALERWLQRTRPAPILEAEDVFNSLLGRLHPNASRYRAFYNSEIGGIVTHPGMMLIHMDDHMVHRGHSVFDTAELTSGHLYCLDAHFARFISSAAKAGILLPHTQAQMYRIILETAAASRLMFGSVRYWLSVGRGGFGLSPSECITPTFYVMVTSPLEADPLIHTKGLRVCTSSVPAKDSFSATVKSTNYLLNALNLFDAEQSGYDQGIFVDEEENVLEGPNINLGIITKDHEMIVPPFERTLEGITLTRLLSLVPEYITSGTVPITSIQQRPINKYEAMEALEVFVCGSSMKVRGVTSWDDAVIAEGRVGEITMQLHGILTADMEKGTSVLTAVPYGYLTASGDWVE